MYPPAALLGNASLLPAVTLTRVTPGAPSASAPLTWDPALNAFASAPFALTPGAPLRFTFGVQQPVTDASNGGAPSPFLPSQDFVFDPAAAMGTSSRPAAPSTAPALNASGALGLGLTTARLPLCASGDAACQVPNVCGPCSQNPAGDKTK